MVKHRLNQKRVTTVTYLSYLATHILNCLVRLFPKFKFFAFNWKLKLFLALHLKRGESQKRREWRNEQGLEFSTDISCNPILPILFVLSKTQRNYFFTGSHWISFEFSLQKSLVLSRDNQGARFQKILNISKRTFHFAGLLFLGQNDASNLMVAQWNLPKTTQIFCSIFDNKTGF